MEGNVRPVADIIEELANKWDSLSDAQRQVTSLNVSGTYQLSRFNALLQNYSTAVSATETALNSQGSAMREQEKYNESLEARINRLQTAWYSFANTVSQNGLYDTIVVTTQAMEAMTGASEGSVNLLNIFSVTLGTVGIALTLLSTRFAKTSAAMATYTKAKVASTVASAQAAIGQRTLASATATTSAATVAATTATATLTTALRSLMLATGVGAAFVVLGFAIEKIISAMSEMTQESERIDTQLNKNAEALTTNKDEVTGLIAEFQALTKAKEDNNDAWTNDKEQEYLGVQQRLADMFPALVSHIDSTGQSYILVGDELQRQIELTEALIEAKKQEAQIDASDTIQERIEQREALQNDMDTLAKQIDSFEKRLANNSITLNTEDGQKNLAAFQVKMRELEIQYSDASQEIISSVMDISQAFATVDLSPAVVNEMERFIRSLDLSNLDSTQLKQLSMDIAEIGSEMETAFQSGNQDKIAELSTRLTEAGSGAVNFQVGITDAAISLDSITKSASLTGKGIGSVTEEMDMLGEESNATSDKITKLTEDIMKLTSVEEQLTGVSYAHVENSQQLLFLYEQLSSQMMGYNDQQLQDLLMKKNLTAEEQLVVNSMLQREEVLSQLAVLYPEYAMLQKDAISLSAEQVDAMKREEEANRILQEAYKLSSEGKYTSEQNATLVQAQGTRARIDNIKAEIAALNLLQQEARKAYENIIKTSNLATDNNAARGAMRASSLAASAESQIASKFIDLPTVNAELDSLVGKIGGFNTAIKETDKSTKSSSKSAKDANDTAKESIYITDQYKLAMERLNLAIEKQQALQAKYPKHSESYRKAIQEEIKLQKERAELIENQAKSVQSQINSGRIAQTGTISQSSTKSSSTSVSGYGRLTSGQGYRTHPVTGERAYHAGVDLASARGTRLDSFVNGTVTKQGYNNISGNYVKITDDKGVTHFFGHLDKILTQLGDSISAGQQIGTIGATGRATGSHLHYEAKDSSGKQLDAMSLVQGAMSGTVKTSSIVNSTISNTQQSIDEAKSTLNGLQSDLINAKDTIEQLEQAIVESYMEGFTVRRTTLDEHYSYEETKLKTLNRDSGRYNATLDNLTDILKRKQNVNKEELDYINNLVKEGNLSAIALEEMSARTLELKTSTLELNNQIGQLSFDRVTDLLDFELAKHDSVIAFESAKIAELDKNSNRYTATLEKMNKHTARQKIVTEETISSLNNMINSGKYSGEVLQEMKDKVNELTINLKGLAQEINDNNYEILVSVKTRNDEQVDDMQFEIDRSKIIQGLLDEGSVEYQNEIDKQISYYKQIAEAHDTTRRQLQRDLAIPNLYPEQIKEATELLEDETTAYLNALSAIRDLEQGVKDTSAQLQEDLSNKVIEAYKAYYGERRDEHLAMIDDELEAEEELYNKRKQLLQDELNLYKKNVQERLDLIDKQEDERTYEMEVNELIAERTKLQQKYNTLALDNSYEAKSQRKDLQEQLDEIDKEISEKRHDRDITLQKDALNEAITLKEEEINAKEIIEDADYQKVVNRINAERAYYEKYYNDLLNDERRFAQIKEEIVKGNFSNIKNELFSYADELEGTMSKLEDTLGGTMDAVGTSIRQNIIDQLREAIDQTNQLANVQSGSNNSSTSFVDDFSPNSSKDTSYNGNTSQSTSQSTTYGSLNNNDFKVMFGKYLSDIVGMGLSAGSTRDAVKAEGRKWAAEGRGGGSVIPVDSGFNTELAKFSDSQQQQLKNFISSNSGVLSGTYKNRILNGIASLDTGGYINSHGKGMDGKGGKFAMLHPRETVLDAVDTQSLFSAIDTSSVVTRALANIANKFSNVYSNMVPRDGTTSIGGDTFNVTFGDVYNTSQSAVKKFATDIISESKRTRGR